MSGKSWGRDSFLPWVEGVALHIGDPVERLRFLRAAVPSVEPGAASGVDSGAPRRRPFSRARAFMPLVDLAVVVIVILAFTIVGVRFMKAPKAPGTPQPGITVHHRATQKAP
jgi:hypothetical protein